MTSLIQMYYEQAQLSDAAYAVLAKGMSRDDYEDALVQRGFTIEEAADFADKYAIVDVFSDDETSFYAVLFQEKDASGNLTTRRRSPFEGKRGTGYLFGVLRGRPRGRSVESRPAVSANWACHSGDPKGDWRFRQVRSRVSSCSKRGSSIHRSHSVGSGTGGGSTNVGCLRLDHGHCVADSTSCARTGLRST